MDTVNGLNTFLLAGELGNKGSHTDLFRQQYPQLFSLLDAVPFFAFSPTGIRNICQRFRITRQTLEEVLLTYTRPGEATDIEGLAACLATPVFNVDGLSPTPGRKASAGKYKKGGGTW